MKILLSLVLTGIFCASASEIYLNPKNNAGWWNENQLLIQSLHRMGFLVTNGIIRM